MKNIIILVIGVLFSLYLTGCEKDPGVSTEKHYTQWQKLGNDVCLNSYTDDNHLYLMTYDGMKIFERGKPNFKVINYVSSPLSKVKFPIRSKYFCYADNNTVYIQSLTDDTNFKILDLKTLDKNFTSISLPDYKAGEALAINNNDVMLIPYYCNIDSTRPKLILCKIGTSNNKISIVWAKAITIDYSFDYNRYDLQYATRYAGSFGDKFFITFSIPSFYRSEISYLIYEDGVCSKVNFPTMRTFNISDTLIAIDNKYQFYQSLNGGVTWNDGLVSTQLTYYDYQFTQIDNKPVIYGDFGFSELNIVGNSIVKNDLAYEPIFKELLYTNPITSITALGDSVFATTLTGYYYKPKGKFFEPK